MRTIALAALLLVSACSTANKDYLTANGACLGAGTALGAATGTVGGAMTGGSTAMGVGALLGGAVGAGAAYLLCDESGQQEVAAEEPAKAEPAEPAPPSNKVEVKELPPPGPRPLTPQ